MNVKCFLIEDTGKMTPFINGVSSHIYRIIDTGKQFFGKKPVGSMWYIREENQNDYPTGPDGKTLLVMTPGGSWNIDSRASNCGLPEDDIHRCWIRHGTPPNVTVDKNGNTCTAGAGSILMDSYHGFLRNGELTDC